ncbi:Peptidyl-prolyl cis-trans isomerase, FKBP-type [Cynara cardunculus var. scolymus]|uniref:peptidylprolyl isomerase n=1 Tax=Cynara cardunculus var. scolymus TaxID=59895 RepID=A0A103UTV8_CYNCS|nr:Peptidyl-prolyl cis-trans isomerase, FKBP-type [Cynara cardunculus var. scolymus]
MAISMLQTLTTPFLYHNTLRPYTTRPHRHCTIIKASSPSSSNPSLDSNTGFTPKPNNNKRRLLDMGVALLAATMLFSSPFDANATRIEYYATVAEPSCELQFAPSGLGYCDVAVGFGEEVPYSQLINIHYTARFADGTVFDSSYKRGRPLTMRVGVGKVEDVNFKFLRS